LWNWPPPPSVRSQQRAAPPPAAAASAGAIARQPVSHPSWSAVLARASTSASSDRPRLLQAASARAAGNSTSTWSSKTTS
jgi:hypothetical protein